jgi:tetratricopeptide (TPR) repeat protein
VAKIEAVLHWLEAHPTWLMILDNVDDAAAVAAVTKLMPRLQNGHVVVTARATIFPTGFRKLEVDMLEEDDATRFLLERTAGDRVAAADDETKAREIAREFGGLALALEQAGAYIAKRRIRFAQYLELWSENRDKALAWSDATLTGSEKTLATTWVTSVDRLSPQSRRLLERLAMLAPDPIPDSLFDVPVPGEAADYDAHEARAGLASYSLIAQRSGELGGAKGFVVHRLVQDFARRAMSEERREEALPEALGWLDAAFLGDAQDVRTWPELDPLAPHALALAQQADEAGIAEPTARFFNDLAVLSYVKARYAEAEPLYRRALQISEASYGPDHLDVGIRLNNLGSLLQDTNRLAEAEPLKRRALKISEASYGPDHPQRGGPPGQSRAIAPSHESFRRGRAALSPRDQDR